MNYKICYLINFIVHKSKKSNIYDIDIVLGINKGIRIKPFNDIFSEDEIYMSIFKSIVPYYLKLQNNKDRGMMLSSNVVLNKIISEEELFYLKLSDNFRDCYTIEEV